MTVYINPSKANGVISAPPSKSIAHRALICAALSGGSKVFNIEYSNDIKATLKALERAGANASINGDTITIGGLKPCELSDVSVDCAESGSTLRFLIPLSMISGAQVIFKGSKRLFKRDLSVYSEIAKLNGISFILSGDSLTVSGRLKAGVFTVRGDISSQFISGLMFALPLLDEDSSIEFSSPLQSKPYVDITIAVLSCFGVEIENTENGYYIKGNQQYKCFDYIVEGDYSNAAALDAFNLFGGQVAIDGLNPDTHQGDRVYKNIFKTISSGGSYDLSDCPDLAPLLFGVSAFLSGARFIGTARLKIKESDRANAMKEELEKFGAKIFVYDNEVIVEKSPLHAPILPLNSHNDHRIVMALCPLLSVFGGEIYSAEAVNKSYPSYFNDIKKLGIGVKINDN
ncbi:MAG: 3-phosphoshikimate 1-carboxyvinyltransferase [Clostridia bacterium]|nr:3-phosphoshikimate 1-carboxyvinyltransferase [Clostridia bacterium]